MIKFCKNPKFSYLYEFEEVVLVWVLSSPVGCPWVFPVEIESIEAEVFDPLDGTFDEGVSPGFVAHHVRVLTTTLGPPSHGKQKLQVGMLPAQGGEFLVAPWKKRKKLR